jgi:hypothetical protein
VVNSGPSPATHLPSVEWGLWILRRKSKSGGKMQQAVSTPSATYDTMVRRTKPIT